jgi:hypothetical protein
MPFAMSASSPILKGTRRSMQKRLWRTLKWKLNFLKDAGCTVGITTQFGFDADAIVRWIARLRNEGIDVLVRVGIRAGQCGSRTPGELPAAGGRFRTRRRTALGHQPARQRRPKPAPGGTKRPSSQPSDMPHCMPRRAGRTSGTQALGPDDSQAR